MYVTNEKLNFKKGEELQEVNSYVIRGLRPFTQHNLTVSTARNAMSLAKGIHTQNLTYEFTTLPGGEYSLL